MSSDLIQLIGFLLEKSDDKKLISIATSLQGERIFQVLPRILITPSFRWEPSLYAESSLGSYEEINFPKKEADKLIESKYPRARVVISTEGIKYLVDLVPVVR